MPLTEITLEQKVLYGRVSGTRRSRARVRAIAFQERPFSGRFPVAQASGSWWVAAWLRRGSPAHRETHQGRPWPTCTQTLARPTLALGIPFAQLKKLPRSPENSVPSAAGQTRLRREAWAVHGPRAPGGHRLASPARCVAQAQVCNVFPRRGRKNDYFLREDVHSISSL